MKIDAVSFDAHGFNSANIHRATGTLFNPAGFDRAGFDATGYNRDGFNFKGIHRNGTKFDENQCDWLGFQASVVTGIRRGPTL